MCNCADMPDMPARHADQDQTDMHCADMLARPGQLWRKTFTFIFPGDKDKTLVPWTVLLVFVATA